MYDVRSAAGLTKELIGLAARESAQEREAGKAAALAAQPIAIVGVHGISPIQQYAFQDQLATGLLSYLNAEEKARASELTWSTMVYWPRVHSRQGDPALKPSALRLYRSDEPDPEAPRSRVYDVYEGYWSPYSKGKTNIASALRWLLNITFLATSSTASIPASWRKLGWDLGYILVALVLAALCLTGAFVAGVFSWNLFLDVFAQDPAQPLPFWSFATNPLAHVAAVQWSGWLQLAFDVLIAYLLVQLFVVWKTRVKTARRTRELRHDASDHGHFHNETISAGTFHRIATTVLVVAVVVLVVADALILLDAYSRDAAAGIAWHSALLVAAVALFQIARGIADFAVEDLLGDVQIYTTHDCNSTYYAIRGQILDAVTKGVLGPLNAVDTTRTGASGEPEPLYEKIHVAGHSLGTTVGLDVLIRLRQLVYEGAVKEDAWCRIRSFTTFGTALEKTRFFFDVRNPTVNAAAMQWQNDVYGKYFTLHRSTLQRPDNAEGIFWSNHWYFRDVVANRIVSYESDIAPGAPFYMWHTGHDPHAVCEDNEIRHERPIWAFVHGDYLGDPLFWKNAGPVFTS
jgi:hypothetical protein